MMLEGGLRSDALGVRGGGRRGEAGAVAAAARRGSALPVSPTCAQAATASAAMLA